MKAKDLDKKFDEGKSILENLDLENAKRPILDLRRVNIDFPIWMINSLDKESHRLGITRQSLLKMWVAERLEKKQ